MNNITKHAKCSGGIIINKNQEIAIVNQNHDSWSLPKGHIDPGESRLDAAKREIYEETGIIDLKLIRYLGEYSRYRIGLDGNDDKSELKTIYIFLFHSDQKELNPVDQNNPEAKWVHYTNVEKILTHPEDKKFYTDKITKLI